MNPRAGSSSIGASDLGTETFYFPALPSLWIIALIFCLGLLTLQDGYHSFRDLMELKYSLREFYLSLSPLSPSSCFFSGDTLFPKISPKDFLSSVLSRGRSHIYDLGAFSTPDLPTTTEGDKWWQPTGSVSSFV